MSICIAKTHTKQTIFRDVWQNENLLLWLVLQPFINWTKSFFMVSDWNPRRDPGNNFVIYISLLQGCLGLTFILAILLVSKVCICSGFNFRHASAFFLCLRLLFSSESLLHDTWLWLTWHKSKVKLQYYLSKF